MAQAPEIPEELLVALSVDIDTRISGLVLDALPRFIKEERELLVAFMHAAYGQGYCDATTDGGSLLQDHNLRIGG